MAFFSLVNLEREFLSKPAREWETEFSYNRFKTLVSGFSPNNDIGERAVKLALYYENVITKDKSRQCYKGLSSTATEDQNLPKILFTSHVSLSLLLTSIYINVSCPSIGRSVGLFVCLFTPRPRTRFLVGSRRLRRLPLAKVTKTYILKGNFTVMKLDLANPVKQRIQSLLYG